MIKRYSLVFLIALLIPKGIWMSIFLVHLLNIHYFPTKGVLNQNDYRYEEQYGNSARSQFYGSSAYGAPQFTAGKPRDALVVGAVEGAMNLVGGIPQILIVWPKV